MDNAVLQVRHMVTDFLKWEMDDRFSRDNVVIAPNQLLVCGTVVGKIGSGSAQVGLLPQNAGNGTIGAVTVAPGVAPGIYKADFLTATTFELLDPEGNLVGDGATGTAFNFGGLQFTVTAGSTAFAVGDGFRVAVNDGAGTVAIFDPTASDGTQNAVGIVTDTYNTMDGLPQFGAILARNAHIIQYGVKFKSTVTPAQKAAALAVLNGKGIIVLREA